MDNALQLPPTVQKLSQNTKNYLNQRKSHLWVNLTWIIRLYFPMKLNLFLSWPSKVWRSGESPGEGSCSFSPCQWPVVEFEPKTTARQILGINTTLTKLLNSEHFWFSSMVVGCCFSLETSILCIFFLQMGEDAHGWSKEVWPPGCHCHPAAMTAKHRMKNETLLPRVIQRDFYNNQ